ncbi:MAG: hypothetical protein LAP85_27880 [Acidobacteriia bacterium]|nr:hypothetical protein [Terriglobia bacterium]
MAIVKKLLPLLGVVLWFGTAQLRAQEDETPAQKQYREDYDQFQKSQAVKEPLKRADEWLKFLQERPKSQLLPNVQADYLIIMNDLANQSRWDTMVPLAERFIKLRPRVGEIYYYYGQALNGQKKFDDAINALAKCYILRNPGSDKAKRFLDSVYKLTHNNSTDGLDARIQKIRSEIGG